MEKEFVYRIHLRETKVGHRIILVEDSSRNFHCFIRPPSSEGKFNSYENISHMDELFKEEKPSILIFSKGPIKKNVDKLLEGEQPQLSVDKPAQELWRFWENV